MNESSMTLRQRYEAQKGSTGKPKPTRSMGWNDDSFLGELVGQRITVRFMNSDEVTGVFDRFDRYAIRLHGGLIILKHSIQTIQLAREDAVVQPPVSAIGSSTN